MANAPQPSTPQPSTHYFVAETREQAVAQLAKVWAHRDYPGHLPGVQYLPTQNPNALFVRDLELIKVRSSNGFAAVVCVSEEITQVTADIVRDFAEKIRADPRMLTWARLHNRSEWNTI